MKETIDGGKIMSKERQENWLLCNLCGRLLYFRHLNDHLVNCTRDSAPECSQPLSDHAFIQDGCLYAVVAEKNISINNSVRLVNIEFIELKVVKT